MNVRTLAAATLALGLSACAQQMGAVSITAICSPPTPEVGSTGGYSCTYPAECATFITTGKLDATTARLDFRLPLQFVNQLADNSSTPDGRVNTNDATVQSLEVTYAGGGYLEPWNVAVSIPVATAGTSSALVALIPLQYFPSMAPASPSATAHYVVSVRAHGVFASGDAFTSAWFQVPVDVCAGCLSNMGGCATGSVPVFCPAPAPGQVSPGQTAGFACIALQ